MNPEKDANQPGSHQENSAPADEAGDDLRERRDPDALESYRDKRHAGFTPEPMASVPATGARAGRLYVIHEHKATRHHYDLRLEIDGVLVSWAIPHGPTMNPEEKRLAVKVEAHPLEYVGFEAVIPEGNYGAGPMVCWDRGLFRPLVDPAQGLLDGEIKFELWGYKLRGAFTLVHTGKHRRGRNSGPGSNDWLLIKKRDLPAEQFLASGAPLPEPSVLSGLTIDELRAGAPRAKAMLAKLSELAPPKRAVALGSLEPMLCQTAERPFSSPQWLFELKYDGYRLLAEAGAGRSRLRYRSGQDPTDRYPEVTAALRALPVGGLVLDGEIVAFDNDGRPDFHKLAERAQLVRTSEIQRATGLSPVTYVIFDMLAADGYDLRGLPLLVRKSLLEQICPKLGPLRYGDHVAGQGEAFFAQVLKLGLEGVVAKRLDSPYRATRSRDWQKVKADPEADFAICGFTPPKGGRTGLGALHLCVRAAAGDPEAGGGPWLWAGKVGTGFDDELLRALRAELEAKPRWQPTFPRPEGSGDAIWIEPELVAQVRYREWPQGHAIRFPVFERLRRDKSAADCGMPRRSTLERDAEVPTQAPLLVDAQIRELRLSNPKKVFWPDDGVTKGELIAYYRAISPWLLPYLVDRPTVLTRYPDGITGESFYQKDMPEWIPPWLRTIALWSEHSQREVHYVLVDDADGLAFLANLASIPIHVWASRIADLERPDWTIIDLDPKNAPKEHVVPLALAIHELCESVGLPNYVKTSGQTGLHVLVPLAAQCTFAQARALALLLARIVEHRHPTMATTHRNPDKRGGKVYLDWGQNAHGQLLVAPFSVRPVPGAPVSMPLVWGEVVPALQARQFHLRNALERMERLGYDPVRPILTERPDLVAVMGKLEGLVRAQGDT